MRALSLDVSLSLGFALSSNEHSAKLRCGMKKLSFDDPKIWRLLSEKEKIEEASRIFGKFLTELLLDDESPMITDIVIEEPPHPGISYSGRPQGLVAIALPYAIIGAVSALICNFDIKTHLVDSKVWKKHFTGRGVAKKGEDPKAATIARCHQLGYMPFTNTDNNTADACGILDWFLSTKARVPQRFEFFRG